MISQLEFLAVYVPAGPWTGERKGNILFKHSCAFLERDVFPLVLTINQQDRVAEKDENWERECEDGRECRFLVWCHTKALLVLQQAQQH